MLKLGANIFVRIALAHHDVGIFSYLPLFIVLELIRSPNQDLGRR
jgi:hypothetical protein